MPIDPLDHGDARSCHSCDRGNIVARHESFADPQISETVDGDFGSDLAELFSLRNLLFDGILLLDASDSIQGLPLVCHDLPRLTLS